MFLSVRTIVSGDRKRGWDISVILQLVQDSQFDLHAVPWGLGDAVARAGMEAPIHIAVVCGAGFRGGGQATFRVQRAVWTREGGCGGGLHPFQEETHAL